VQWHPEYRYWENPQYNLLLQAFHDAAKVYQARKVEKCGALA
jgi:putative glutamine amidotransferase